MLTLTETLSPEADLAAGCEFVLYRDTYLLPEDYVAQDQALYEMNFGGMSYTHPREWLYENRYVFAQGIPQCYTITGDPQYPGRLVMRIFPWPYEEKSIDFIYKRRPRVASIGTTGAAQPQEVETLRRSPPGATTAARRVDAIARSIGSPAPIVNYGTLRRLVCLARRAPALW